MPRYNRLRINDSDSEERRARKKHVAGRVLALRGALREHVGGNGTQEDGSDPRQWMRLATWNIREFPSSKYGERLKDESYYYIAEILSHFDVIAVQEVRDDLEGLEEVMYLLGPGWAYIATDVCEGSGGNRERMVFVYNRSKVSFRNVAGEMVLSGGDRIAYPHTERLAWTDLDVELPKGARLTSPANVKTYTWRGVVKLDEDVPIELPEGTKLVLKSGSRVILPRKYPVEVNENGEITTLPAGTHLQFDKLVTVDLPTGSVVGDTLQFARSPFMVSLQAGWLKLMLCTVHIYYGTASEKDPGMRRRKTEIRHLTKFLAKRAQSESDSDASNFFVVLGDFNIVGKGHGTMEALVSSGFTIPKALQRIPGSNVDKSKAYDQIAYWTPPEGSAPSEEDLGVIKIEAGNAGVFDFFEHVFRRGAQDPGGADEAYYKPIMKKMQEDAGATGNWTYKEWRTYQMSDHLPMWVKLRVDFGDDFLTAIGAS